MRRRRLLWQLFPSFLAVALAAMVAISFYAARAFHRFHLDQVRADLVARARLLQLWTGRYFEEPGPAADEFCKKLGREGGIRLTLIATDGRVLGDSDSAPESMENHAGRPEVREALAGRVGLATRYSSTLQRRLMYAALPVRADGEIAGVVRTALPLVTIEAALQDVRGELWLGAIALLALTAGVGLAVSRWITRPIEQLTLGARRLAAGDLRQRVAVPGSEEIGGLAVALNFLAEQLGDKIGLLEQQRNQLAAVLASMVEGVIAVDGAERVIEMNGAAARLLGVEAAGARGRSLQETVRNPDLQRFVARTLASDHPTEADLVLFNGQDTYLQAHGTTLRSPGNEAIGALVVLNDVTRLRRLENIRRDFVANVSHELKTPITSIKGFAETLRDGALANPEEARRFTEIIVKQSDRLGSIIEDLLSLSRIEQDAERGQVVLEDAALRDVLAGAIQLCQVRADAKSIRLDLSCDPRLRSRVNAPLLEQAVVNLIDNAVKYSEPTGTVRVGAVSDAGGVAVSVADSGCGIPAEHQPRLFERFYRVDKARSRQMGGTGLGLAIVKHIAQAHGGRVSVESAPGKGSVFTIHLPPPA